MATKFFFFSWPWQVKFPTVYSQRKKKKSVQRPLQTCQVGCAQSGCFRDTHICRSVGGHSAVSSEPGLFHSKGVDVYQTSILVTKRHFFMNNRYWRSFPSQRTYTYHLNWVEDYFNVTEMSLFSHLLSGNKDDFLRFKCQIAISTLNWLWRSIGVNMVFKVREIWVLPLSMWLWMNLITSLSLCFAICSTEKIISMS